MNYLIFATDLRLFVPRQG